MAIVHTSFVLAVPDLAEASTYHREISARGAIIPSPPTNRPWGMREMVVHTPQGHRMMFGQQI